eukprot:6198238-Pleurochrysis_carterae.AAC.6
MRCNILLLGWTIDETDDVGSGPAVACAGCVSGDGSGRLLGAEPAPRDAGHHHHLVEPRLVRNPLWHLRLPAAQPF